MENKGKHYFVCANCGQGFVNYFADSLAGMRRIFILKGGPGNGKSTLMRRVGAACEEAGMAVDYIHCSSDPASLDGVIVLPLALAVVDGTAPHVIEPQAPGAVETYVDLGCAWDVAALQRVKDEILAEKAEISRCYERAYAALAEAKDHHDKLEALYQPRVDFQKIGKITDELLLEVLGSKSEK